VEGGTLQAVGFDPLRGGDENVGPIVIETEHEAAVDLMP
jgi:hypothetical protein